MGRYPRQSRSRLDRHPARSPHPNDAPQRRTPTGGPPMVDSLEDSRRVDPSFTADERHMLEAWLEFHRITLLMKCEGLDDAGRKKRPIATSKLSLHGLIRHMAEVERNWFQRVLLESKD